jgi:hypothetical protein
LQVLNGAYRDRTGDLRLAKPLVGLSYWLEMRDFCTGVGG